MKTFFFSIFTAFFISLLIDIFGFNYQTLVFDKTKYIEKTLPLDSASLSKVARYNNGIIYCTEPCDVTFSSLDVPVKSLEISTSGSPNYSSILISYKDSSEQYKFIDARRIHFSPASLEGFQTFIFPFGDLKELKLSFLDIPSSFALDNVTINPIPTLQINWIRILLFTFLFSWIFLVHKFPYVIFNKRKIKHVLLLYSPLVLCLCCASLIFTQAPSGSSLLENYDGTEVTIPPDDIYNLMFYAFLKGNLFLEEAHPSLMELDNPYDVGERESKKPIFPWDNVYYKGKIYIYNGIAPILALHCPIYWLTGFTPAAHFTKFLFACFAIIALFLALYEMTKYFCKQINLTTFISSYLAIVFASLIFPTIIGSMRYYTDKVSFVAFSVISLFLFFKAYNSNRGIFRNFLLSLAGISYVLVVLSRPLGIILVTAFIFPIFLSKLTSSNLKNSFKRIFYKKYEILSFILPIIVGAVFTMIYNYLRFDSPFEFGVSYQLSVHNQNVPRVFISDFIPSLVNFFFYAPNISSVFPYVSPDNLMTYFNGHNFWKEPFIGLLFFPINFMIFFTTFIIKRKDWHWMFYFVILSLFVVIFYTFTAAGLILRYVIEINWSLTLISAISLCYLAVNPIIATNKIFKRCILLLSISTVIVGMCVFFSSYLIPLSGHILDIYLTAENLL